MTDPIHDSHATDTQKVLAANEKLREDIGCLAEKLDRVSDRGDRTRLLAYLLTVAIFGAAILWLYDRTADNRDRLDVAAAQELAACERSNQARAGQRQQWRDVRDLLAAFPDKATRVLANQLVLNAEKNFPELDCSLIWEGKPPVPKARVG